MEALTLATLGILLLNSETKDSVKSICKECGFPIARIKDHEYCVKKAYEKVFTPTQNKRGIIS